MYYKVFQYAIPAPDELDDLNRYLATNRITSVTHHVVANLGGGGTLVVIVESVDRPPGKAAVSDKSHSNRSSGSQIDYRDVLSEEDFTVFSRLREVRKKQAEEEGIPLYSVFNNAQLAEMVTSRTITEAKLGTISGVGKGRVDKYSSIFLPVLKDELDKSRTMTTE